MNFYKRHLGDIAKACGHLSQGAMGAYDLLLDWHYANEAPLPLTKPELYRIGRAFTKGERDNVDQVLSLFFTRTDTGYVQKRAQEEMAKASAQAETNRRIAEEREARRRETNEARIVHESCNETTNDSCTNRSTKGQPSQTPDSRKSKSNDSPNGESSAPPDGEAPQRRAESIPYAEIVSAYNATMTRLPRVREITPKRRTLIRAAWQASAQRRSLDFWQAYFEECEDDQFLNGVGPYREPHANWRPDFDYLLRADVITRTFERAMDRLERAA